MAKIASIERAETLTDQAEAVLRQALTSGVFSPGQAITLRSLASSLGVSVTPAKDALARLIGERVLEGGPRRLTIVPKLTEEAIEEIYIIRLSIEPTAAEHAVDACTKAFISDLEEVERRLSQAMLAGDYKETLRLNREFHFKIYELSGLPHLVAIIESLWLRLGPSLNLLYSNPALGVLVQRAGVGYHSEIVSSMRSRDKGGVRQALEADLSAGRDRMLEVLKIINSSIDSSQDALL